MDKNKIIGFSLIALVFIGFTLWSQPSQEEIEARRVAIARQDSINRVQEAQRQQRVAVEQARRQTVIGDSVEAFFNARNTQAEIVTLHNDLVSIDINTRGGLPERVELSQYKDYRDKQSNVVLFNKQDIVDMRFTFDESRYLTTDDVTFTRVESSDSTTVLRMYSNDQLSYIEFAYQLRPNAYMLDLVVTCQGMGDILAGKTTMSVDWAMNLRQQEKGFAFENRYAGLYFKEQGETPDDLSGTSDDSERPELPLDWVAFKNQFFSCMLIAHQDFTDAQLTSRLHAAPENGDTTLHYLKRCTATMKTALDPDGITPTQLQFYFGPNDYHLLQAHNELSLSGKDLDMEDIVPMGWTLFRWINKFLIRPLFDLLHGWGLHMGLVILLLTIIVKLLVYPATKKSFMSSARMRVLKPKIDVINAKYPNKEDALKKQQEVMSLYSQYGVSPMGGCLPMLIQMPIWIALFNFVPNAIQMRGQSFLWADDLSAYDEVLSWSGNIPLIGNHLSIFCLLFCATNIVNTLITMRQQQQNAISAEQQSSMKFMKWMMYIMPVMFFFMFNNYASGLCYYYFLSGLTSVLIMWYLRRSTDDNKLLAELERRYEERKAKGIGQGGGAVSGLSGMAERLQELQRRQEEERRKKQQKK